MLKEEKNENENLRMKMKIYDIRELLSALERRQAMAIYRKRKETFPFDSFNVSSGFDEFLLLVLSFSLHFHNAEVLQINFIQALNEST